MTSASSLLRLSLFLLLTIVVAETRKSEQGIQKNELPNCPHKEFLPKYHGSQYCRPDELQEHMATRETSYLRLLHGGIGATQVPNQRTVVCPQHPVKLQPSTNHPTLLDRRKGLDQKWLLENLSSTPVVVNLVYSNGNEFSSLQPGFKGHEIILKPGDFKAIPTYEGYVYHVREKIGDGNGTEPGRLLLQHRVGLIPIWSRHEYDCRKNVTNTVRKLVHNEETGQDEEVEETIEAQEEDFDNEPLVNKDDGDLDTGPDFSRTATHKVRKCNTMDLGFRNLVNCPVDVYWAANLKEIPTEGKTCKEKFRFHLGKLDQTQNFFKDWKSSTKWEGSFVSHTFLARLSNHKDTVVDSYTVQPTRVVDCPSSKKQSVTQHETSAVEETAEMCPTKTNDTATAIIPACSAVNFTCDRGLSKSK
jgi:hypothetical protein